MKGQSRKITREIYQVGGAGLSAPDDAAVYLVHFGDSGALIDAGCGKSVDVLLACRRKHEFSNGKNNPHSGHGWQLFRI